MFLLNLAIGLAGFMALDSFKSSIDKTIKAKSKVMLGADFGLSARRPITLNELKIVTKNLENITKSKVSTVLNSSLKNSSKTNLEQSKMVEIFSMVANTKNQRSRLIQIRAIESNYPFYGEVTLQKHSILNKSKKKLTTNSKNPSEDPDLTFSKLNPYKVLKTEQKVWVHPEVLSQLQVAIGDTLKIGQSTFTIEDVVLSDSASGFTTDIAPRIYLSLNHLKETALIRFGSVAWYSILFKLPQLTLEELNTLRDQVFQDADSPELQVYTHEKASEQMAGLLIILNDYLGLASLVALFLAGIGTAFLIRSYFSAKIDQIAILLSLGLTPTQSIIFYMIQIFILGLLSSIFAILFSFILIPGIGYLTQDLIPFTINLNIGLKTVLTGFLVGGVGSLLIGLPFAFNLLKIKPLSLLVKNQNLGISFNLRSKIGVGLSVIPCLIFFWLLAILLANSWKVGSLFLLLFTTSGLFLAFVSLVLFNGSKSRINPSQFLSLNWALRDVKREKLTTTAAFIAIGIAVLLLNLIPQLQKTVMKDLVNPDQAQVPSFFMFDIQDDQIEELKKTVATAKASIGQLSPTIRARLTEVNGVDFSKGFAKKSLSGKITREAQQEQRSRNRGYNLSYRKEFQDSEKILEGRKFSGEYIFTDDQNAKLPEISLEKRFAQNLGLKVNDILTFEIDGVPISGQVINLRSVKWSSFEPNFFILFQSGALDLAPKSFVATVQKLDPENKTRLQDAIVQALPNISIIDVTRVIKRLAEITDQIVWALQFMSMLCLISGFIVIFSIINHQASLKKWDIGLLKAMGTEFTTIRNKFLWQFAIIASAASLTGILCSFLASFLLAKFVLNSSWSFNILASLLAFSVCIILSLMVTYFATYQALRVKTIELLNKA